jgi:spore germination protein PE
MKRTALVGDIQINGVSTSSIVHIGDTVAIRPRNRVFAVQRQIPTFWSNEGDFEQYPIFSTPIPLPAAVPIRMSVDNLCSIIQVGRAQILGISSSSIMQVGNNRTIDAEARIKNIRQFITDPGTDIADTEAGPNVEADEEDVDSDTSNA